MPTPINARVHLERVALADLKPAPYNPREIGEREREGLRHSLAEFGLVEPIIVNRRTGHVVGGHQRLALLRDEGITETDVVFVDLPPAKERALNLALNNPHTAGRFTDDVRALLVEVEREHADLADRLLLRDLEDDLPNILGRPDPEPSEPSTPAAPKVPTAKVGDLWHLGRHRLICADATQPETVERLLEGALADLVYTDPPYGVDYAQAMKGRGNQKREAWTDIASDHLTRDALLGLLIPAFKSGVAHARPTAPWYVWHASTTREDFAFALRAAGLTERQYLLWVKPSIVFGRADYQWAHEPCFYAAADGHSPTWYGGRDQPTVWRIARGTPGAAATVLGPGLILTDGAGAEVWLAPKPPKGRKARTVRLEAGQHIDVHLDEGRSTCWEIARDSRLPEHPTQKPVALAARALTNSSRLGDRVLDLFAGSGSTLLAAESLGRIAYLAELDPAYCEVIVGRWERATGKTATCVPRGTPPATKAPGKRRPKAPA